MRTILSAVVAAVLVLGVLPAMVVAQPSKDQLKSQFEAREKELRDLKRKGVVGETVEGYVEAVTGAAGADGAKKVVADENKDRRALYQILADEINKEHPDAKAKATMDLIAVRNAARNFEKAGPEEFVRVGKDHWIRAKDFPRFQKLAGLKARGVVGETAAGQLEVVKPGDAGAEAAVKEENAARTVEYKAIAGAEKSSESAVAARMGKRNFDNARTGEMLKDEGGSWRKK